MCLSNLPRIDTTPHQGGYRSPVESGQKGSEHQEIVHVPQVLVEKQTENTFRDSRLPSH